MAARIRIGDLSIDVEKKDIKKIHLSVYPPVGRVRISAPLNANDDALRAFAISKLEWIRRQRRELREQDRETPRDFVENESHNVWGRRLLLKVEEASGASGLSLKAGNLVMRVRPGSTCEKRAELLDEWYRSSLRENAAPMIGKWQDRMGLRVRKVFIRKMKTRWGSCNASAGTIRLNTDLAKKPRECLEYIIVHEMAHLIEPTHGPNFVKLMDRHMPTWRELRKRLNGLPLKHEEWRY